MRMFGSERIMKLMDRMGIEEGEVIQHSMITSSIERAQRKVEENNFGIRKRLIEYDDVMNSQREVIYTKRRRAIFGERLSIDINNMLYDTVESLVNTYHEEQDYDSLKLDLIRILSIEIPVSKEEFSAKKPDDIIEKVFEEAQRFYKHKSQVLIERTLPFITEGKANQGTTITKKEIHLTVANCVLDAAKLKPSYITCDGFTMTFQNESFALNMEGEGICETNNYSNIDDVFIYPNPFRESFKVELKYTIPLFITIYNSVGKIVLYRKFYNLVNDLTIDTFSLNSGLYIVVLTTNKNRFTKKIIKIN